eukprot:TRINITY_DN43366_c0_g1_i1.p1 TRINITY_DN43366_c0_g1~~TRINITY_DN43366_c0_g1_i1.p1  ORF type:complete len:250 (+),score=28.71 TRINITY_DN43366_c0_g1_i1:59-808(+)
MGEVDFDCWETAKVDPAANFNGPPPVRTVFGYASLIFRPGFPFIRAYPVRVRGFSRRFWQRSVDHRGTLAEPGRVATLVSQENMPSDSPRSLSGDSGSGNGASDVYGVAYDVAESDWAHVLLDLDFRERHGYIRTVADIYPPNRSDADVDEAIGKAVVYFAHKPAESAAYCGPESIAATAQVIASAVGPSGRNDAYLFALETALLEHGTPADPYIEELVKEVRSLQSRSNSEACVKQLFSLHEGEQGES